MMLLSLPSLDPPGCRTSADQFTEEERPPTYNAENYTANLVRFSRAASEARQEAEQDMFSYEMGLRQFGSITELLSKLSYDLQVSYESFVTEFVRYPNDGVHRLLDLLKSIQLSQTEKKPNQGSVKKAQSDEYQTLFCLKTCTDQDDGALKILDHPSGLFTVAVCMMSNFSKSRVLALQLLTRICHIPQGHSAVADALSMLRLKFGENDKKIKSIEMNYLDCVSGEPVRFKFLIGSYCLFQ